MIDTVDGQKNQSLQPATHTMLNPRAPKSQCFSAKWCWGFDFFRPLGLMPRLHQHWTLGAKGVFGIEKGFEWFILFIYCLALWCFHILASEKRLCACCWWYSKLLKTLPCHRCMEPASCMHFFLFPHIFQNAQNNRKTWDARHRLHAPVTRQRFAQFGIPSAACTQMFLQ